jgi:hypothetical protein
MEESEKKLQEIKEKITKNKQEIINKQTKTNKGNRQARCKNSWKLYKK